MNEVATGIAGTETALGARLAARRTCSPEPSDSRTTLSRPSISSPTASMPPTCSQSGWAPTGATSASTPESATTPPWSLPSSDTRHSSGGSVTRCSSRRRCDVDLRYSRCEPHFRVVTDAGVDDGYYSIVLNTNPYTYLGNRPLDLSHAATFDRGLVAVTFRTMRATAIVRSLIEALRGGRQARSLAGRADRPATPGHRARAPVPISARRRLPR